MYDKTIHNPKIQYFVNQRLKCLFIFAEGVGIFLVERVFELSEPNIEKVWKLWRGWEVERDCGAEFFGPLTFEACYSVG